MSARHMTRILPAALVAFLAGCSLATPFKTSPAGELHQGPVYIGVTNAKVDGDDRRAFDEHTKNVIASLPTQEGYLGHSVRSRDLGNEVWTMTIWKDERTLDQFVRSPVHRQAMRQGTPQVLTAKFDRFEWPSIKTRPSWSHVIGRLESVDPIDYAARRARSSETEYGE